MTEYIDDVEALKAEIARLRQIASINLSAARRYTDEIIKLRALLAKLYRFCFRDSLPKELAAEIEDNMEILE